MSRITKLKSTFGALMLAASVATAAMGISPVSAATLSGMQFATTTPSQWSQTATAEKWIDTLTPNQSIKDGIVQDPNDAKTVYFAASSPTTTTNGQNGTLLSIYKYNTSTQQFERLSRATYGPGEVANLGASALPEWHVIGYDNGKVVFATTRAGYVLPVCAQSVIIGADGTDGATLMSVSSNFESAWSEGRQSYTAPAELLTQARGMQQTCQNQQQK